MATTLKLLLPVLLATLGALGVKYEGHFDGYSATFDRDVLRDIVTTRIRCDTPDYTFQAILAIQNESFHYYFVTNGAKEMALAREELEKHCGLILHERAFHDMFFFNDFMVTNLDDATDVVVKLSGHLNLSGLQEESGLGNFPI
ncbi:hypothetical protein FOZ60_004041 [Perkinsus olseni]|uniref:Uncharacterized protein n=1 Tax=Perkinsus olseni TaxID=32597 RepID=A0A7J6NTU9_PEROL|nr:hypothetical protein FOZ60_004041 [Perkinsus olseni]